MLRHHTIIFNFMHTKCFNEAKGLSPNVQSGLNAESPLERLVQSWRPETANSKEYWAEL
jgi:hypothetical protein